MERPAGIAAAACHSATLGSASGSTSPKILRITRSGPTKKLSAVPWSRQSFGRRAAEAAGSHLLYTGRLFLDARARRETGAEINQVVRGTSADILILELSGVQFVSSSFAAEVLGRLASDRANGELENMSILVVNTSDDVSHWISESHGDQELSHSLPTAGCPLADRCSPTRGGHLRGCPVALPPSESVDSYHSTSPPLAAIMCFGRSGAPCGARPGEKPQIGRSHPQIADHSLSATTWPTVGRLHASSFM